MTKQITVQVVTKPMTMKELLEYMHELAMGWLHESDSFDNAFKLYIKRSMTTESDIMERLAARDYLISIKFLGIGSLNIENMIKSLEEESQWFFPPNRFPHRFDNRRN